MNILSFLNNRELGCKVPRAIKQELINQNIEHSRYSVQSFTHSGSIDALDVTINGIFAVTATSDTISYWNLEIGKRLWQYKVNPTVVLGNYIKMARDRIFCLGFSKENKIYVIDAKMGKLVREIDFNYDCRYFEFEVAENHFWKVDFKHIENFDFEGNLIQSRESQLDAPIKLCHFGDMLINIFDDRILFYTTTSKEPVVIKKEALNLQEYSFCDATVEDSRLICSLRGNQSDELGIFTLNLKTYKASHSTFPQPAEKSKVFAKDECIYMICESGKCFKLVGGDCVQLFNHEEPLRVIRFNHPLMFLGGKRDESYLQVWNVQKCTFLTSVEVSPFSRIACVAGKIVMVRGQDLVKQDFLVKDGEGASTREVSSPTLRV